MFEVFIKSTQGYLSYPEVASKFAVPERIRRYSASGANDFFDFCCDSVETPLDELATRQLRRGHVYYISEPKLNGDSAVAVMTPEGLV